MTVDNEHASILYTKGYYMDQLIGRLFDSYFRLHTSHFLKNESHVLKNDDMFKWLELHWSLKPKKQNI
jgi:hypothetical protein